MENNYEQLVKALRCGEYKPECGSSACPYWSCLGCMDRQLMEDAAAAIEALQAEVGKYHDAFGRLSKTAVELEQRVVELRELPKQGEWELIDGAEPMRWGCSRCKYMSWDTSNYCPRCGAHLLRDHNAAINIREEGLRNAT